MSGEEAFENNTAGHAADPGARELLEDLELPCRASGKDGAAIDTDMNILDPIRDPPRYVPVAVEFVVAWKADCQATDVFLGYEISRFHAEPFGCSGEVNASCSDRTGEDDISNLPWEST